MKLNDRFFRKIFIGLVTFAFMLFFILGMTIFLGEPINSVRMWVGSLIVFFSINMIFDINGVRKKMITLFLSIVAMFIFFHSMLEWSFLPSLYGGAIILILGVLLYMTFVG